MRGCIFTTRRSAARRASSGRLLGAPEGEMMRTPTVRRGITVRVKADPTYALVCALAVAVSGFSRTASAQGGGGGLGSRIVRLVASVSEQRLGDILRKLQSFETRSTLSSTNSTARGVGGARQWILDEMKSSSPKLQVSFDAYQVAPQGRITRVVDLRNVMAVLPGRSPRRIYINRHSQTR